MGSLCGMNEQQQPQRIWKYWWCSD